MVYEQGDIIEVNFDPTKGHEQAKTRPALVVSTYQFNRCNSMTIVCPISWRMKPFFLHEPLPDNADADGCVIMEQVRAIDLDSRPSRKIGHLDADSLRHILTCIRSFFDEDPAE